MLEFIPMWLRHSGAYMRLRHLILAVCVLCGSALAGERVAMNGFAYAPPSAPWEVLMLRPRPEGPQARYDVRDPQEPLGSAFIHVIVWRDPGVKGGQRAALDYLKAMFDGQAAHSAARFRITVQEMAEVPIDRTICSRWHIKNEDRGVPGHQGEVFTTLIDSYTCPHPDDPTYFVEIMYSVRLPPGGKPFTRDADLDDMANSLQFTSLK